MITNRRKGVPMIKYFYVINMIKGRQRMSSVELLNLRFSMVKYAMEHGISEAARVYKTTRKTVRKWLRRYKEEGIDGLRERSRTPRRVHNKTSSQVEERIVELRRRHPSWGPARLKEHYGLSLSEKAIWRILKERGFIRRRRRKKDKRRDLREAKKIWKAFEFLQVDVKYLTDIGFYYPLMKGLRLPLYQYTARDVRTGAVFYAYAYSNDTLNASFFAEYILSHLRRFRNGRIIVQTDNGSEFIGSVGRRRGESRFQRVLGRFGVIHQRIYPRCPTWNSDVEAVHRIIEDEFYECEVYRSKEEFLKKAYAYQLYFNPQSCIKNLF